MSRGLLLVAVPVALSLAACSGTTSAVAPHAQSRVRTSAVSVTITIPPRSSANRTRRPAYIGAGGEAFELDVTEGGQVATSCVNTSTPPAGTYTLTTSISPGSAAVTIKQTDVECTAAGGLGSTAQGQTLATFGPQAIVVTPAVANSYGPYVLGAVAVSASASAIPVPQPSGSPPLPLDMLQMRPGYTPGTMVEGTLLQVKFEDADQNDILTSASGDTTLASPLQVTLAETHPPNAAATAHTLMTGIGYNVATGAYASCGPETSNVTSFAVSSATCGGLPLYIALTYDGALQSDYAASTIGFTGANLTSTPITIGSQPSLVTPPDTTAYAQEQAWVPLIITRPGGTYVSVISLTNIGLDNVAGAETAAQSSMTMIAGTFDPSLGAAAGGTILAVDSSCVGCPGSGTPYAPFTANAAMGTAQSSGLVYTTVSGMLAGDYVAPVQLYDTSGNPFSGGVGGVVFDASHNQIFLAANNAVYSLALGSGSTNTGMCAATPSAGNATCIYGTVTLIAGAADGSHGDVDSSTGTAARFYFAFESPTIVYDPVTDMLYLIDGGNTKLRAVNETTGATTSIQDQGSGLAVDPSSGWLYVAFYAQASVAQVSAATPSGPAVPVVFVLSGYPGAGTHNQDGLGVKGYPLQFNAGSPFANGSSGANPLGSSLGFTADPNAGAQNAGTFLDQPYVGFAEGMAFVPTTTADGRFPAHTFVLIDNYLGLVRDLY